NRGEAGTDVFNRVVPEDEVGREERAPDPGCAAERPGSRSDPPVLPERKRPEDGKRPEAAEERARRWRHVRLAVEDPGEGNRERSEEHAECRMGGERSAHPGSLDSR